MRHSILEALPEDIQSSLQVNAMGPLELVKALLPALNGITGMLAKPLRADGILVNPMCPGWTATDMGDASGFLNEAGAIAW
jgi:hypothetical protein